MIKPFKFFQQNDVTGYNGEMAQEAVRFFYDYVRSNRTVYERTTNIATYRLGTVHYEGGEIIRGKVIAYEINNNNIKITFDVNLGSLFPFITGHTIEFDYWNTVGQLINALDETI